MTEPRFRVGLGEERYVFLDNDPHGRFYSHEIARAVVGVLNAALAYVRARNTDEVGFTEARLIEAAAELERVIGHG